MLPDWASPEEIGTVPPHAEGGARRVVGGPQSQVDERLDDLLVHECARLERRRVGDLEVAGGCHVATFEGVSRFESGRGHVGRLRVATVASRGRGGETDCDTGDGDSQGRQGAPKPLTDLLHVHESLLSVVATVM